MDESQKVIRITKSADEKLVEIARRKHLSKSKVATRIITHYYSSNIGMDLPSPEDYKGLVTAMLSLNGKLSKIIGPVERTEDFIKSLVREDRRSAPGSFSGASQDMDAPDVPAPSSDSWSVSFPLPPLRRILKVMPPCRSVCRNPISTSSNANTRNYVRHAVCRQHPLRSEFRCRICGVS